MTYIHIKSLNRLLILFSFTCITGPSICRTDVFLPTAINVAREFRHLSNSDTIWLDNAFCCGKPGARIQWTQDGIRLGSLQRISHRTWCLSVWWGQNYDPTVSHNILEPIGFKGFSIKAWSWGSPLGTYCAERQIFLTGKIDGKNFLTGKIWVRQERRIPKCAAGICISYTEETIFPFPVKLNEIWSCWQFSCQIKWNMIVVTVLISIVNKMEFNLVQEAKGKLFSRSHTI